MANSHEATLREWNLRNVYMYGEKGREEAAKRIGSLHSDCLRASLLVEDAIMEVVDCPYSGDEANMAVARSLMQAVPKD